VSRRYRERGKRAKLTEQFVGAKMGSNTAQLRRLRVGIKKRRGYMATVLGKEDVVSYSATILRAPSGKSRYSAVIVFSEGQWLALCPQLDIVAQADTPDEAFEQLVEAVKGAVEWAAEDPGRTPGEPIPDSALRDFMLAHELTTPAANIRLILL